VIETVKYGQDPRPGLILPPWFPRRKHGRHHPARRQEGMLWVPQKGILRCEHNFGGVGTATVGTLATTGAASSTKGTPVEVFSATAFDAYWLVVLASQYGNGATTSQGCLDILVGAATEEVLVPNLLMGFCGSLSVLGVGPKCWQFPVYIPAGTRLAVQVAGDRLSTGMRVGVCLYGGGGLPPFRVGSKVTTYGITTVPAGTDVAAGASGAEGAWVQIDAATDEDHFAFVPSFHPTDGDTTLSIRTVFMDMGIGAATEELLLGVEQSYIFHYDSGELCGGPFNPMPAFHDVPSGTRLVARLSMDGANDTGSPDCAIHAVS
jgi:hypothetical protein